MSKQSRVKERVTVKMSKEFLNSRRESQRGISDRHVMELADAMLMGRWIYNGESIKFDDDGYMIDGQHRCMAGVRSGKAFLSDISYGLPVNSYYTIDQKGKHRSCADVLKINGEINITGLASALSWHLAYSRGCLVRSGKSWPFTPDAQQICIELERNPNMRESIKHARGCSHMMGPAPLGFLHYIFNKKDPELTVIFFNQLRTGENLPSGSPVLFVRKMLLEDKIYNKAKLPIGEKMACIIKAWNLMRKGKTSSSQVSIKWSSRGKNTETFPSID